MRLLNVLAFQFSIILASPADAGVITIVDEEIFFTYQTDDAFYNFRRGSLISLRQDHPTEEFLLDYEGDSVETLLDNFVIDANLSTTKIRAHAEMYFRIRETEGFLTYNDTDQVMRRLSGLYYIDPEATERNSSQSSEFFGAELYWVSKAQASSSTVPEPSTAITMGLLGLVGFAGSRRRRRQGSVA